MILSRWPRQRRLDRSISAACGAIAPARQSSARLRSWRQPKAWKLSPFSAALFPKGRRDGKFPEINTVKCDFAFLTLDEPVKLPSELANRKVTAIELRGNSGVTLTNNRRTPDKSDDIEVFVARSPLFYEESRNLE